MEGSSPLSDGLIKKLDTETGRFYYVSQSTGENFWDTPSSANTSISLSALTSKSNNQGDSTASTYASNTIPFERKLPTEKEDKENHLRVLQRNAIRSHSNTIIQKKQDYYIRDRERELYREKIEIEQKHDAIWKDICDRAAALAANKSHTTRSSVPQHNVDNKATTTCTHACVRLAWKNLGHISPRIYNFQTTYGISLIRLCIVGNNLTSTESIGTHCHTLEFLDLSCNNITCIADDDDLLQLKSLKSLILLRNQINSLPASLDCLKKLEVLELANNKLKTLPPSFGNLEEIVKLNLECNELTYLPETLQGMSKCETLLLSSNQLQFLPESIARMPSLHTLSVNDNQLRYLPSNIGQAQHLKTLHASKNNLMELPLSICRLNEKTQGGGLTSLWLDSNPSLAALPPNFHFLTQLKELKMEHCVNMVYPNHNIIRNNGDTTLVLDWSRKRKASAIYGRQLNIVLSVQDILKQVHKYKIGSLRQPFLSIFELVQDDDGEGEKGEEWYQFPINLLWELFIPKLKSTIWNNDLISNRGNITSFTYERNEVELVLFNFQDACGNIMKYNAKSWFRRCSCCYLDKKIDNKNIQMMKRTNNHGEDKKRIVCIPPYRHTWMCERPAVLVRKDIVLERHMTEKRRMENETKEIRNAVRASEVMAKRYLDTDEGKVMVREIAEERMKTMTQMDEQKQKQQDCATTTTERIRSSIFQSLKKLDLTSTFKKYENYSYKSDKLKIFEDEARREYIQEEGQKRKEAVLEMNKRLKLIMKSWLGLSMEQVFHEWRNSIEEMKERRSLDREKEYASQMLKYEEQKSILDLAKKEVTFYTKYFDYYNDIDYWVHCISGEIVWKEPKFQDFLPEEWSGVPEKP